MAHRMAAALTDAKDVNTEMSDKGRDANKRQGPSDSYGTTNRRTAVSPQPTLRASLSGTFFH